MDRKGGGLFPKTDISEGWGSFGTEGGAPASFFKRYYQPLLRYGRHKFGLDESRAEELVSAYMLRQLQRERDRDPAIFRLYDANKGRFRSLLATSFWRYCRDQLKKEQKYIGVDFELLENSDSSGDDYEFCRLVAREFFNTLRTKMRPRLKEPDERAVLALKWPADPDAEPASNAEIERELNLTRARVRTISLRLADHFTYILNRQIHDAGFSADEARDILGDCCRVLDREQRDTEDSP